MTSDILFLQNNI